jgi:hypothetical protein
MKIGKLPPIEVLREHLDYNPETGELRWIKTTHARQSRKEGSIAGSRRKDGYERLTINQKSYLAHRICWALHYGEDPYPYLIDHKRGVEEGNKIDNLRKVTDSGNMLNAKRGRNNTSGHRGVSYKRETKKWTARIDINGEQIWLGCYDYKEDAISARLKAEADNNIYICDR